MRKKILAMLLAVIMVAAMLPTAFAAEALTSGTCGENVTWLYENGVLTIEGTGPMNDYNFLGKNVAPWRGYVTQIRTIIINDGVTSIGDYVFYAGINLTSVTIPDSVTSIGNGAFDACKTLTSVTIPGNVTSIGESAFRDCDSLTGVTIPDSVTSIGKYAFSGCDSLTGVTIPNGVTVIEAGTFDGCTSLTSVTIPNSVTSIGINAFVGCKNLTSVTIPSSVTSIGGAAFSGCRGLTSVTIPDGVTAIEQHTFQGCTSLISIIIPASVKKVGLNAFYRCESLTDVYYGGSNLSIDRSVDFKTQEGGNKELLNANFHYNSTGPEPETPPEPEPPQFTDVPADAWYLDAVNWAVTTVPQITVGATSTTFEPEETCKQVQILTFLWRAEGKPAVEAHSPFEGENPDYQSAMDWAYDKEMITDSFNPNAPCTRSDAVKYIWQVFGRESAPASDFTDVDAEADYAAAVSWAVANGVVLGYEDNTFKPDQTCERAHIITFLYRAYVEPYVK